MLRILCVIAAVALASGCAEEKKPGVVVVTAAEYGDKWPLNTADARLGCTPPSTAYIEANGKRYALNGKALRDGLPRPDEIRRDVNNVFMADFTERAMQLCLDQRK
jgi:hypothetical protein